jgi:hypothetical protein
MRELSQYEFFADMTGECIYDFERSKYYGKRTLQPCRQKGGDPGRNF